MPQAAIMDRSSHSPPYKRHRPAQTLLYQVVEQYYPEFIWRDNCRHFFALLG